MTESEQITKLEKRLAILEAKIMHLETKDRRYGPIQPATLWDNTVITWKEGNS